MSTLFPLTPVFPPGFSYLPEFLTIDEEKLLIASVQQVELHPMQFQGYTALRKVRSYGYNYDFNTRKVAAGDPIPGDFHQLQQKVADHMQLPAAALAEMLIIEYPIGSVINWHRDAPPFDQIAGISLLSDVTFKLRPHEKARQNRKATISFTVDRRSLYIMESEVRADWQHCTAAVKAKRYSITFRTMREDKSGS